MYNLIPITYDQLAQWRHDPIMTTSIIPPSSDDEYLAGDPETLNEWWIVGDWTPSAATLYGAGTRVDIHPDDMGVTLYGFVPKML